jgi:hypothetical protein
MRDATLVRGILQGVIVSAGLVSCGMIGYSVGVTAVIGFHPTAVEENAIVAPDRKSHLSSSPKKKTSLRNAHRRLGTGKGWSTTPSDWDRMTYSELREYYACGDHASDQDKELPTLEDWMFLKKQYREIVEEGPPILDSPILPTEGYSYSFGSNSDNGDVRPPPYYADMSVGKGRGLFASRYIKKGDLVHDGPKSNVMFPDANAFRRLVVSLPRKTACDITEWAWTQKLSEDGNMRIFVDLNIAALMNTSRRPNIAPRDSASTRMYATRDIKEGEEITYDYAIYDTNWSAVGLG